MNHNPRVVSLGEVPYALGRPQDRAGAPDIPSDRPFAADSRHAVKLESLDARDLAGLRRHTSEVGLDLLEGHARGEPEPRSAVVGGDDFALRRLADLLERAGRARLGEALRSALEAYHRREFALPLASGRRLALGNRTRVMGILNVTPDSFSDGGRFGDQSAALDEARRMAEAGADIIDVGGESTRPGAEPVPEEEEVLRVVPIIEAIKTRLDVPVSVDTMKPAVAGRALEAGADVVNDVSALRDPDMGPLLARTGAPVVLMHMRGTPGTMQRDTAYEDLMSEILAHLRRAIVRAGEAGVDSERTIVDPGLGFGKSADGNRRILRELESLRSLGRPILVGASRKAFIGATLDLPVDERLEGSLAVAALAAWKGAQLVRVHDVKKTVRVVRMIDSIKGSAPSSTSD